MAFEMEIPYRAFFAAEERPADFQDLLHACFDTRGELRATIAPDHVRLEVLDQVNNAGKLRLSGCWRAPDFQPDDLESLAAKLTLPFLFKIAAVGLPHSQIYTLGHDHRPLADFFMRNLFLAICRDVATTCETITTAAAVAQGVSDFQRQYFSILKATFDEPALEQGSANDAIGFIQANAYLPILNFNNPLLQHGAQHLRFILSKRGEHSRIGHLKSQVLEAREKMLVHFDT